MRLIAELVRQAAVDTPSIGTIFLTRVDLSQGKTLCRAYFYTPEGKEHFETVLEDLKLYKPSMRTAIAHNLQKRYAVDLLFCFDEQFEKTQRLESLFEKIKE